MLESGHPLLDPMGWKTLHRVVVLTCLGALCSGPSLGWASGPGVPRKKYIEVRFAASQVALERLPMNRLRRYLAIELEDEGEVSTLATGPLNDNVALVWVDLPSADIATIEVRLADRPRHARQLRLRQPMRPDVTARLVALTAAEMVRRQSRPLSARRTPQVPVMSPERWEQTTRGNPSVQVASGAVGSLQPETGAVLAGTELSVGYRFARVKQAVFARWMAGEALDDQLRWVEAGVSAGTAQWMGGGTRVELGVSGSAATVRVATAGSNTTDWTARAALNLDGRFQIGRSVWLGMGLEPGFVLRRVSSRSAPPDSAVGGVWLGAQITLQLDRRWQSEVFRPANPR